MMYSNGIQVDFRQSEQCGRQVQLNHQRSTADCFSVAQADNNKNS